MAPTTPSNTIKSALESNGVTRKGLIRKVVEIAETGQRVTVIKKLGVVVEERVTYDPSVQLKALERLEAMLDKAEGRTSSRHFSYRETNYNAD